MATDRRSSTTATSSTPTVKAICAVPPYSRLLQRLVGRPLSGLELGLMGIGTPAVELAVVIISQAAHVVGPRDGGTLIDWEWNAPSFDAEQGATVCGRKAVARITFLNQTTSKSFSVCARRSVEKVLKTQARSGLHASLVQLRDRLGCHRHLIREVAIEGAWLNESRGLTISEWPHACMSSAAGHRKQRR